MPITPGTSSKKIQAGLALLTSAGSPLVVYDPLIELLFIWNSAAAHK